MHHTHQAHPDKADGDDEVSLRLGPIELSAFGSIAKRALNVVICLAILAGALWLAQTRIVQRLDRVDARLERIEGALKLKPAMISSKPTQAPVVTASVGSQAEP